MKSSHIIMLSLFMITSLPASNATKEDTRNVVKIYEIEFKFFNLLMKKWDDIHKPKGDLHPKVHPWALMEAGGIILSKGDIFQHNIRVGRHIIIFRGDLKKHIKFINLYKSLLKVDPKDLSDEEHGRLLKEEERLRQIQREKDGPDPFGG